jgi:hypothetical protein
MDYIRVKSNILDQLSHWYPHNTVSKLKQRKMTKTVLITGASRGLGLQFTAHYVKAGWRVIATARNVASAEKVRRAK